jgi:hypothetical protein
MTPDAIFSAANTSVLPGWLLLIVLPRWRYTQRLAGLLIPILLGLTYATVMILHFGEAEGGFGSLAEVRKLFANPWAVLGGWIHYLAFDLFTGCWEVRDARRQGVPHWAVIPCLLLTFMFGPVGLTLYLLLRLGWKRQMQLEA